jgi:hypothetical protein
MSRASRVGKSLFQGSSSSSNRREVMLRCARDEEQCSIAFERFDDEERERCGEDVENVGEEAELEHVLRQTRRSHVVAPPIASTREEDTVRIRPLGDR